MFPTYSRILTETNSITLEDVTIPSQLSRMSKRTSRAMSLTRVSKLMTRDSLSPAPTKEEFALDAQVIEYQETQFQRFSELMHTMDKWLFLNRNKIYIALAVLYKTRYWSASYFRMKNVLRNFNAPCNEFEMHVVCRVLDTLEIRRVSYKAFSRQSHVLLTNGLGMRKLTSANQLSAREFPISPSKMKVIDDKKQFANILFMYAPLYDIIKHPGHFSRDVCLDLFVYNLKWIIEKHLGLVSEVRVIYGMRFMENTSTLPWDRTLWELGFKGGCKKFPTMLTLYYDIDTENRVFDCSLFLNANYYLKNRKAYMKSDKSIGNSTCISSVVL